ncbi:phenylacetic acid degradation operon negative regulatory protein [Amylibacter marinus]|uniref:Phenylacetic acid degradation operon negative regulatory protein n=1 Tax=Amylibacter marinus TaxID=1475483 RepID=A0ABQ5VUN3_9RHOB|nr:PaaX family transcriptional regulator C-terminal domain-containing protein [Amylibacter marinus]GLQ35150.1 phenylacetic acid degradation operon negative regulatory protein [Amylibacter marinus]
MITPLVRDLHDAGRLRVWSLIITILGDVAHPHGGTMSMSDLLTLTDHMDIDQGAIRTALSRLSKEEWVIAKKTGRTSAYAFSHGGRAAFESASAQVYAPRYAPESDAWVIAVLPPQRAKDRQAMQKTLAETNALQSQSGVALWPATLAPKMGYLEQLGCLSFVGDLDRVPSWAKAEFPPPEAELLAKRFIAKYQEIGNSDTPLPALDAMVARILILHDWRRMVLRYPAVPAALQPDVWTMTAAHALVVKVYKGLLSQSESGPISLKARAILDARF